MPYAERLAPGDVGPGDVTPYVADDPMLVAGFEATGDEDVDEVALWELGLGRHRVLSAEGREAAAQRWYDGEAGPTAAVAVKAPAPCSTCGFFVPMAGALRAVFGVCANEWSPSDGRVVSLDHGCGAHSEADLEAPAPERVVPPILDDFEPRPRLTRVAAPGAGSMPIGSGATRSRLATQVRRAPPDVPPRERPEGDARDAGPRPPRALPGVQRRHDERHDEGQGPGGRADDDDRAGRDVERLGRRGRAQGVSGGRPRRFAGVRGRAVRARGTPSRPGTAVRPEPGGGRASAVGSSVVTGPA